MRRALGLSRPDDNCKISIDCSFPGIYHESPWEVQEKSSQHLEEVVDLIGNSPTLLPDEISYSYLARCAAFLSCSGKQYAAKTSLSFHKQLDAYLFLPGYTKTNGSMTGITSSLLPYYAICMSHDVLASYCTPLNIDLPKSESSSVFCPGKPYDVLDHARPPSWLPSSGTSVIHVCPACMKADLKKHGTV